MSGKNPDAGSLWIPNSNFAQYDPTAHICSATTLASASVPPYDATSTMRFPVPHPIPYQGSKRLLAPAILAHMPAGGFTRLVEPFAGSAAVTLAAAANLKFEFYVIADVLKPLVEIWQSIVVDPVALANEYESLWLRERKSPIGTFYEIRAEFNNDRRPAKLLYLLARCVKNAVRFNPDGNFNQSPDKRRKGTNPSTLRDELLRAHRLLAGRTRVICADFRVLFSEAAPSDFFYLDPPYQGTSNGRDRRYLKGVDRATLIEGLKILNKKRVPFILSYDGACGARIYGDPLPPEIAKRILVHVGRSSQATLNGKDDETVESLYISPELARPGSRTRISVADFKPQSELFC